jgi:hypothetical protein
MDEWLGGICFSEFHQIELYTKKRALNGKSLVQKTIRACSNEYVLNGYILDNIEEFYNFIDLQLNDLYSSNYSFYSVLFGNLKTIEEINNEFPNLQLDETVNNCKKKIKRKAHNIIQSKKNEHPFSKYNQKLDEFKNKYDYKVHFNMTLNTTGSYPEDGKLGFNYYYGYGKNNLFNYYVEDIIAQIFIVFVLNMQNPFREFKGLPKIGEGWISETELYYLIKNELNTYLVLQHGKPDWLGRQHFDIWIPELGVALEFQGEQHDRPVDFFGGERVFLENKKRDEIKRTKCIENNVRLIEVRKGYILSELINQILR